MTQNNKSIFENQIEQPEFMTADMAAKYCHVEVGTVYEWKYRPGKFNTPQDLFIKFGRKLLVRTSVLKNWVNSRNSA